MGEHPVVVGIGGNNIDIIYRADRIAGPESKRTLLAYADGAMTKELIGGVTLNHLGWTRVLGVKTGLLAKQADDRYGGMLRSAMDAFDIDRSHVTLDGSASNFTVIFVDEQAERAIYMAPAAIAETTPGFVKQHAGYIKGAKILSIEISQLPLDCVLEALRIAKENGVLTVVDLDLPPEYVVKVAKLGTEDDLREILQLADVIKPTKEAAMELFPGTKGALQLAEDMVKAFGSPGKLCAITDGKNGCAVAGRGESFTMKAVPVLPVDTTGAGDAFLGGFIAGLVKGLSLQNTAKLANAAGAACCEQRGAFPLTVGSGQRIRELYRKLGGTAFE